MWEADGQASKRPAERMTRSNMRPNRTFRRRLSKSPIRTPPSIRQSTSPSIRVLRRTRHDGSRPRGNEDADGFEVCALQRTESGYLNAACNEMRRRLLSASAIIKERSRDQGEFKSSARAHPHPGAAFAGMCAACSVRRRKTAAADAAAHRLAAIAYRDTRIDRRRLVVGAHAGNRRRRARPRYPTGRARTALGRLRAASRAKPAAGRAPLTAARAGGPRLRRPRPARSC